MKKIFFKYLTVILTGFTAALVLSCGDGYTSSRYNELNNSDPIELQDAISSSDLSRIDPLPEDKHLDSYDPEFEDELEDSKDSYLTHGQGGKSGNFEERFTCSGTYSATSYYKLRVPQGIEDLEPHGLLIYLHGDGGKDYTNDYIFSPLVKIAHEHKLIAMSVLSPNNGTAWYQGPQTNAYFLHQLLETKIFKDYNIDTSRIYFTGSSGGSQFLTGIFVPKYVGNYGGGAFPSCGGADIYNFIEYKITDHMKEHFKLYYHTQTGDFLYPQVRNSIARYKSLGMQVSGEFPTTCSSSRCHCEFNLAEVMIKAINYFEN